MKFIKAIFGLFQKTKYDHYILKSTRPIKKYLSYYKYVGYTWPLKIDHCPFVAEASHKRQDAFKFDDDHGFKSVKAFAKHVSKDAKKHLKLDFKIIGVKNEPS